MGSDPAEIDLMHLAATGNQAPLDAKDPQLPEDPGLPGFLASLCALSAVLGSIGERELECSITLVRRDLEPLHAGSSARATELGSLFSGSLPTPWTQDPHGAALLVVQDAARESGWPEGARRLRAEGIQAALAVPMLLDGGDLAVCVFYSPVAEVFGHGVVLGATHHVSRIRNALLLALRHPAGNPATPGELHCALASRSDVDLAVGAVARAQHCSLEEALAALVRAASHGDRKLHAVAAEHLQEAKSITAGSGSGC